MAIQTQYTGIRLDLDVTPAHFKGGNPSLEDLAKAFKAIAACLPDTQGIRFDLGVDWHLIATIIVPTDLDLRNIEAKRLDTISKIVAAIDG